MRRKRRAAIDAIFCNDSPERLPFVGPPTLDELEVEGVDIFSNTVAQWALCSLLPVVSLTHETTLFLQSLRHQGRLSDSLLEQVANKVLRDIARYVYAQHVSRQPAFNYPDHLGQIAFAYGIVNKIFIPEQVAMIRFDHGDTPESFVQEYWNPEWLAVLLQKIDTAMPAEEDASLKIPLTSGTHLDDPHPCCDCGS